jgi:hypothetical protein
MATVITPGGRVGNDKTLGKPGGPGLFRIKGLKLPRYIRIVRNGLMKDGMPEGEATRRAVGYVKNFAEGHTGRGQKVSPKVQAAAAAAIAEFRAEAARARAIPNKGGRRSK